MKQNYIYQKFYLGGKNQTELLEHTEKLKCFIKGDIPWNKGLKIFIMKIL